MRPGSKSPGALPEAPKGGSRASFALGVIGLILFLALVGGAIFIPVYLKSVQSARDSACIDGQKDLARGLTLYAMDFDGLLPHAESWCDAIKTGVYAESFQCINDESFQQGGSSYAFSKALSRAMLDGIKDPAKTPMVFDAASGRWNLNGDLSLLPKPGRHQQGQPGNVIAFADGSVRFVGDNTAP
ncbi:MAG: hypothetical protein KF784_11860 [Fimbriimonadaceae bacterium]|nr:hypothetical protein [Fimbriimonadaceae bacterium]